MRNHVIGAHAHRITVLFATHFRPLRNHFYFVGTNGVSESLGERTRDSVNKLEENVLSAEMQRWTFGQLAALKVLFCSSQHASPLPS